MEDLKQIEILGTKRVTVWNKN